MHVALAERIQKLTSTPRFHARLEREQEALASGAASSEAEALVESLCLEAEPLPSVLRFVCLLSLVSGGIRPKVYSALATELIHAYGYDQVWPERPRATAPARDHFAEVALALSTLGRP